MKVIGVRQCELPEGWTEEHIRVLEHGHEEGVIANATNGRTEVAGKVVAFAPLKGAGLAVFGGMTFVDIRGENGFGPVRFSVIG